MPQAGHPRWGRCRRQMPLERQNPGLTQFTLRAGMGRAPQLELSVQTQLRTSGAHFACLGVAIFPQGCCGESGL